MSHQRTRFGVSVALIAVIALAGACSPESASTGDKGYVDGAGVITQLAEENRGKPAGVAGETLDGDSVDLADYAGKVVVLNVWGSWCGPCRAEAPVLAAAARELKNDGVVFLGINTRDSTPAQGLAFEKRFEVPYPSIFDPAGESLLAFRSTLPPNAIPSTVIIDAEGRAAASILGEVPTQQTLVDLVRDVANG